MNEYISDIYVNWFYAILLFIQGNDTLFQEYFFLKL